MLDSVEENDVQPPRGRCVGRFAARCVAYRRQLLTSMCLSGLFCLAMSAHADGLMALSSQALEHDPTYRAALAERNAGREERAIGRAALLPRLSYQYQAGSNHSVVAQPALFGGVTTADRNYRSYTSALTLQQPLLDYEAWSRYHYGVAQAHHADERFRSRSQELAVRVAKAYTGALYAHDQIELSRAQERAYAELLTLNRRMLDAGEGTRTDVLETQARHDLAVAQEIEARDALDAALRELGAMVGRTILIENLAPLSSPFRELAIEHADFDQWRNMALAQNPELSAQRHALDAAQQRIEQARAGHFPSVSLYATAGRQKSSSEATYDQRYQTNSIGLQVSIPIFAGGGVSASVRQAVEQLEQQRYEGNARQAEILNGLRQQFNLFRSSAAKMRAYQYAVDSARELTRAMQKSVAGGERVNADVLQAEQQYYDASRNLAQARYAYLLSWMTLRLHAGVLEPKDIQAVDRFFALQPDRRRAALP
ncbi:TolC family outer membrane protein [Alcaligenes sp. Marseille-Q7550]